jgi:hypothetical protein
MLIGRWLSALLVSAFAAAAHAQTGDKLLWRCWYDDAPASHIACRLVQWPAPDAQPALLPVAVDRLPSMVRLIRTAPETLADERIVIPLYSPPIDMRFVARLARAVMCGSRTACEVDFSEEPRED